MECHSVFVLSLTIITLLGCFVYAIMFVSDLCCVFIGLAAKTKKKQNDNGELGRREGWKRCTFVFLVRCNVDYKSVTVFLNDKLHVMIP